MTAVINPRESNSARRMWPQVNRMPPLPGGGESAGVPAIEAKVRRDVSGLHDRVTEPVMAAHAKANASAELNETGRLNLIRAPIPAALAVVEKAKGTVEEARAQVAAWDTELLRAVAVNPDAAEIRNRWPHKPEDRVARAAFLIGQVRDKAAQRGKALRILTAVHPAFDPAVVVGDGAGLLPAPYVPIAEASILEAADRTTFESRQRLDALASLLEEEIASGEAFLKKIGNASLSDLAALAEEGRKRAQLQVTGIRG